MKNLVPDFVEEYAKHAALNLGQALQGVRYLYSHPDFDAEAKRGSLEHLKLSLIFRSKRVCNDLYFCALPPHSHHTADEMKSFHGIPMHRWFLYGYCAWRFDETGDFKKLDGTEDPRWDPRCK